jgi:hypothetical protein
MKTTNFFKSDADKCRRKIFIAEINILFNNVRRQDNHNKIVREMGKLHSLWFQGASKDIRLAEINENSGKEERNFTQSFS